MNELAYNAIQAQTGHIFKNRELLKQALTRKSYSEENGGENNEVLEFIGDKVLDYAVVRYLSEYYGSFTDDGSYHCDLTEGELTELKRSMVEKCSLADRLDVLGFSDFIITGKGDTLQNVSQQMSVKEDTFEAVLGAIALDSDWDFEEIQSAIELMLDPESFIDDFEDRFNYVSAIQIWEQKKNGTIPMYMFINRGYHAELAFNPFGMDWKPGVITVHPDLRRNQYYDYKYTCFLKLLDNLPVFRGFGESKSDARKAVCEAAYKYLEEHKLLFTMKDELRDSTTDDPIGQLEILARKGYFTIPVYDYVEDHDNDGNPIWTVTCRIPEYKTEYSSQASSKKAAKRASASAMLEYVTQNS